VVLPAALSIVMNMFEEGAERNKALGIWGGLGAAETVQEADLGEGGVAAMQDDVKTPFLVRVLAIVGGEGDGVRLDGPIDARAVAANDAAAGFVQPRAFAAELLAGAKQTALEGLDGPGSGVRTVELLMADDPQCRLAIDLDIHENRIERPEAAQLGEVAGELVAASLDGFANVFRRGSGGRRSE